MHPELLTYGALLDLLQNAPKEILNKHIQICAEQEGSDPETGEYGTFYEMGELLAVEHPLHLDKPIEFISVEIRRKNPWL